MLTLDDAHPLNQGIVTHLRKTDRGKDPVATPESHPDPYLWAGSHPDTVSWVWETLGGALPVDCRAIVYGTPALVHPRIGVVMAFAYGTAYAMRIPENMMNEAIKAGCNPERRWSDGSKTNVQDLFGHGWLFGCWDKKEANWLLAGYNNLLHAT